jgi:hypothetical protein
LDYKLWVLVEREDNVVEMKALTGTGGSIEDILGPNAPGQVNTIDNYELDSKGDQDDYFQGGAKIENFTQQDQSFSMAPPYQAGVGSYGSETFLQYRSAPTLSVSLVGCAARLGYRISPPMLASVNNVPCYSRNRPGNYFTQGVYGAYYGVPLNLARWNLRWTVPEIPQGAVPVPPNPLSFT